MTRLLRFLWLLARGALFAVICAAALLAFCAGLIWLLSDWTPIVILGLVLVFTVFWSGVWLRSCWAASRKPS